MTTDQRGLTDGAAGAKECWACNGTRVVTTSSNGSGLIEAPCANCTDGVSNEALEQHATAPSDETPQLLDKLSDDLWSALSFIDSTVCREEVEKIAMRLDEDRRRIAGVAASEPAPWLRCEFCHQLGCRNPLVPAGVTAVRAQGEHP